MIDLNKLYEIKEGAEKRFISAGRSIGDLLTNGFSFASEEEQAQRNRKCSICSYRKGLACSLCGCYLQGKVKVNEFQCPIGIWNPEKYADGKRPDVKFLGLVRAFEYKNGIVHAYEYKNGTIFEYATHPDTVQTIKRAVSIEEYSGQPLPKV